MFTKQGIKLIRVPNLSDKIDYLPRLCFGLRRFQLEADTTINIHDHTR